MLAAAIFEDPTSQGARVLAALGVDVAAAAGGHATGSGTGQRPPPDAMMVRFSSVASRAIGLADEAARGDSRPTATGDLLLGLLEADEALREQAGVDLAAYRAALAQADAEE